MKKFWKLAVPLLLLAAMFAVYRVSPDSRLMYSDIAGHWAREEILTWSQRGVMSGTDGKFRPDAGVTRAELATVLTRVLPLEDAAENTFTDVEEDAWYTEAVLRCVAAGILDGGGTELAPKAYLSREEGFLMIARAIGLEPAEELSLLGGYNDAKLLSDGAKPYFEALLEQNLISGGSEVQLYPRQGMTRGEVAAALQKLCDAGYID